MVYFKVASFEVCLILYPQSRPSSSDILGVAYNFRVYRVM